jgi:hypothetical protein
MSMTWRGGGGVEGEQLTGARTVAIFSFRATSWISYVSLA